MDEIRDTRLLRRAEVETLTALKRSAIYGKVAAGMFPAPVKIGARGVRWRYEDILHWMDDLPSAKPADDQSYSGFPKVPSAYSPGVADHATSLGDSPRHHSIDRRTRRGAA